MNSNIVSTLGHALQQWKDVGPAQLDPQLLEFFRSGFFKQYQRFTEQLFVVLDNQSQSYLYVSDNLTLVTGHPLDDIKKGGSGFMGTFMHPDDVISFARITPLLLDAIKALSEEEILKCRLSYDYRFAYADGSYHRWLQHNIPLSLDQNKNVQHSLAIVTDIGMYKHHNQCHYQAVYYPDENTRHVLTEGVIHNPVIQNITAREKEIILLTSHGHTEAAIAKQLGISIQTVKTHRKNLFQKTGVKNSIELVRFAMANLIIY